MIRTIDVEFGNLLINKIDGTRYAKDIVPYGDHLAIQRCAMNVAMTGASGSVVILIRRR